MWDDDGEGNWQVCQMGGGRTKAPSKVGLAPATEGVFFVGGRGLQGN